MAEYTSDATASFSDLLRYLNGSGIAAHCDTSPRSAIQKRTHIVKHALKPSSPGPWEDTGPCTLSILHLPGELLCRILSKLPYDQRLATATVCRTFNDALCRPTAWPDLLLRARGVYPTPPSKRLVCWLTPRSVAGTGDHLLKTTCGPHSCACARDITLRNFDLGSSPLLTTLTSSASRLSALNLELVTGVPLHSAEGGTLDMCAGPLATLHSLQHLGLRHVECPRFPDVVLHLVHLQSLDARPLTSGHPCVWAVPSGITALSRLQHLALASLAQLVLPAALAKLTSLQSLVLDTVRHIDGGTNLPPSLTSLHVAYCWASAPLGEGALGTLTELRRLRVVSCGRRNLTPPWLTRLVNLEEYVVEEDSHEWFLSVDVVASLPRLQVVRFEVDEFLGPAMMYCTGSPQSLQRLATLPSLRSLRILRASGLSAMSYFVLMGLQRAFKDAGRSLHMSFDSSRALLQHNPDGLDPGSLLNRDSYLLVVYGD